MESWRTKLVAGDAEGAWNEFIAAHRKLILATIRRTIGDADDVDDVFAEVCAKLSADKLNRLRRHSETGAARLSTWLVTVVHHQTIDWVRQREGRHRVRPPAGLSPLQLQIFQHVFDERRSHVEAYELIHQHASPDLEFGEFVKEVAQTYRIIEKVLGKAVTHYLPGPRILSEETESVMDDLARDAELGGRLTATMGILPPDERLAVQLFVVDELPAERVASIVGWRNSKAVYNRVYRALALLKKELERGGFESHDH